jgi:hypothetical protein
MRWACVPESAGGTVAQAFALSLIVAAVAAASVALRVIVLEEPFSDRTLLLLLIAAEGAFSAMLVITLLAVWTAGAWRPWLRAALGAFAVGGLFLPATLFFFAIKIRIIDGRIEADSVTDLPAEELLWSMFSAMGMFTPTGLRYLLPWPLVAVTLTAAILLYRWPRATARPFRSS